MLNNTMINAPTATIEEIEDLITGAIEGVECAGVALIAGDAETLLADISDHEQAYAELMELARLIDLHGKTNAFQEAA